jgi:hypothetical protein
MTKQIRIENADTSSWPVRVTVQHKNEAGEWVDQPSPVQINAPTQMTEQYLTSHRRLVIEERPADPPAASP